MAIAEIATGLTSLKTAIEIIKSIQNSGDQLDNAVLKIQMAEIYSALADTKMSLSDAETFIKEKDDEIKRLKSAFEIRRDTVEVHGLKYRKNKDGKPLGTPYCTVCEQKEGLMILTADILGSTKKCPNCNAHYGNAPIFGEDEPLTDFY